MNLFSFFKKSKKKKRLKYDLAFKQTEESLLITASLNNKFYFVHELWLFSRGNEDVAYRMDKIKPASDFSFNVSLRNLMNTLQDNEEETYDWYIRVIVPLTKLSKSKQESEKIKLIEKNGTKYAQFYIRLGRFQYTSVTKLNAFHQNDNYLLNYLTTKGNLSLLMNKEPDSPTKIQIDKVKSRKSILKIEGKLFTRNSVINDGAVILKGRDGGVEIKSTSVTFNLLREEVQRTYGLNRYTYKAEIDTSNVNNGTLLEEDIYDLFLKLDLHDRMEPKYVRIGRPTLRARLFSSDVYAKGENEATISNPYFTFKLSNISLEIYKYPIDVYKYLRKVIRWSWLIRLLNRHKDVWLVGERSYKAQDTGVAFFKYIRTNYPKKEAYYVIDKNSPETENVEELGNVLEFKSKEHIFKTIIAKKVISSHHPDYLYPIKTSLFNQKVKADKVFLQHGVMGTKNMVANYGKNAPGFDTDYFLVSSEFEKEMIVNDFGYSPKNVFITGLSRFDTLFKKDVKNKRQLLIIPTWRDWIVTDEAFFESEYYQRYEQLINNPDLHSVAEKYDFEVILCLHPNMQKFSRHFENKTVKVISQGEVDVQKLIKESSLMLTDYSSVGFDFSFLHKPIIYYQFDRNRFIGKKPSHLDLDNDLPGEICFEQDEVLALLEKYAINDFQMSEKYKERANKFIKFKDQLSSERIFNVIDNNEVKKSALDNPKIALLLKAFFTKYRKSDYYFPSMKLFYKVGSKVIPVDYNLIFFESGIGKQYGDSPKNIYEELLRQDLGYKKVWAYNKNYRFGDPDTKRINRLSPQYYYYLLKAGYWVNNQNFPSYLKKRSKTTYLQTWHGTPLKKMLFDIKQVHGRSDDYLERIGNAVKNWDYLVSPSDYATNAFKSAFKYEGNIIETGYPRNDIFYQENKNDVAESLKRKLRIPEEKKVILYAPTFRDDQSIKNNKFSFDVNMDLYKMREHLKDDYIILLRMHVVVSDKIVIDNELKNFVSNVSNYPDVQELLLITDLLITDYSSVMFDFANTGKPMLFYTYDLEHYRDNIRGFYLNFEKEAPGPLVYSTEQIIDKIMNINQVNSNYQKKYEEFQHKFCALDDGKASTRVVNTVFKNN